ncbi:phospholipid-binding lipoprotein MlaA [Pseudomonas sp. ok272]|uniref:hypothetical protein n=1 Tax=unclassified Pseudomonas TaxID=196821 RepID=UPI0008BFC054|nr:MULTISPECIES: hypothetical protein [unclassified Pseudomonas]SEN32198.1 phospholipid-binding lipoprotein MlaA [Pseudomonas sp. ok272]SFN18740.1 phospholipid-binding lipoprotein MlaA [Pseudomonas sp. ok602]
MPLFPRPPALLRHAALLLTLTYLYGCASRGSHAASATCEHVTAPPQDPSVSRRQDTFAFNRVVDEDPATPLALGHGYTSGYFQLGTLHFTPQLNASTDFTRQVLQGNGTRSPTNHLRPTPSPSV